MGAVSSGIFDNLPGLNQPGSNPNVNLGFGPAPIEQNPMDTFDFGGGLGGAAMNAIQSNQNSFGGGLGGAAMNAIQSNQNPMDTSGFGGGLGGAAMNAIQSNQNPMGQMQPAPVNRFRPPMAPGVSSPAPMQAVTNVMGGNPLGMGGKSGFGGGGFNPGGPQMGGGPAALDPNAPNSLGPAGQQSVVPQQNSNPQSRQNSGFGGGKSKSGF